MVLVGTPILFANNFWCYDDRMEDGLYLLQNREGTVTLCEIHGEDVLDPESKKVDRKKSQIERLIKSGLVRYRRIPVGEVEELWYE